MGNRGYTLIELIIVMVLIGIVAFIVGDSLIMGTRAYMVSEQRADAIEKGRVAMERMEREIRNAISVATATSTEFCFMRDDGTVVSFRYSGTDVLRQEPASLAACPGAAGTVLAGDITSFSFAYVRDTGAEDAAPMASTKRVRIRLTSTQTSESIDFRTDAYPRNIW